MKAFCVFKGNELSTSLTVKKSSIDVGIESTFYALNWSSRELIRNNLAASLRDIFTVITSRLIQT